MRSKIIKSKSVKLKRKAEAGAIRNGSLAKSLTYLVGNQSDFALEYAIKTSQKQPFEGSTLLPVNHPKADLFSALLPASVMCSIDPAIGKKYLHKGQRKSKLVQSSFIKCTRKDLRNNLKEAFDHA